MFQKRLKDYHGTAGEVCMCVGGWIRMCFAVVQLPICFPVPPLSLLLQRSGDEYRDLLSSVVDMELIHESKVLSEGRYIRSCVHP